MDDGGGPRAAATRMSQSVMAAEDPTAALAELAATANDPTLRPRTRATALMAVGLAAHGASLKVPEAALEAIDDPLVVDAVVRSGLVSGLTGTLALASKLDATVRATRAHVGTRLVTLGQRGPHITALLIDAEELELAASAAAEDFVASVMPALAAPNPLIHAWGAIALGWLEAGQERVFVLFCRELRGSAGAVAAFLALLDIVPDADPALVDAAREIVSKAEH